MEGQVEATCKFCKVTGLRWERGQDGKWKLMAGKSRHACAPLPKGQGRPPGKSEAIALLAKILKAVETNNALLERALGGPKEGDAQ